MSDDRIYTLEIAGKPVLTFPAQSFREAQSLLKEAWLLEDLRGLTSRGDVVWDGKTRLSVRNADAAESDRFASAKRDAGDDLPIVYLIDLS